MDHKRKILLRFLLVLVSTISIGKGLLANAHLSGTKPQKNVDKTAESLVSTAQTGQAYLDRQLYSATKKGDITQVANLLKKGANPNATQAPYQDTPLHCASQYNHLEIVKLLVNSGANVRIKNRNGLTPMHYTWFYKSTAVFYFLHHFLRDTTDCTPA